MARVAIALAALLLIAGCGSVPRLGTDTSPAADVIPWLELPPDLAIRPTTSPSPVAIPPGTPACTADTLQGAVIGRNGDTGHFQLGFAFSGRGPGACYLDGTPSMVLLDSAGHTLAFKQRAPDPGFSPAPGPALVEPAPPPVPDTALKLGEAGLTIDWVTQPEACPGEKAVLVATARIAIPGGGRLAIKVPQEPAAYPCAGLGVGAFEAPYVPATVTPPPLPTVALQVPASVGVGHLLDYRVTLTNDSAVVLDLTANCPNYEEELFADLVHGSAPLGGKHIYQLNCAPAGSLQPGASKTFQMIFKVPADAASGVYTLIWNPGYTNAMKPGPTAAVTLTS